MLSKESTPRSPWRSSSSSIREERHLAAGRIENLVLRSLRSFVSSPVASELALRDCALATLRCGARAADSDLDPAAVYRHDQRAKEIIAGLGRVSAALGLAQRRAAQSDDGAWIDAIFGRGALERHALAHARDDVRDVLDRQLRAARQLVELREGLGSAGAGDVDRQRRALVSWP